MPATVDTLAEARRQLELLYRRQRAYFTPATHHYFAGTPPTLAKTVAATIEALRDIETSAAAIRKTLED